MQMSYVSLMNSKYTNNKIILDARKSSMLVCTRCRKIKVVYPKIQSLLIGILFKVCDN